MTDIAVRVRFNEEPGYEPPQGSLDVIEVSFLVRHAASPSRPTGHAGCHLGQMTGTHGLTRSHAHFDASDTDSQKNHE